MMLIGLMHIDLLY